MVDGALFDSLEAIARGVRGNKEPFGGIQLILAGLSYCPLPPSCPLKLCDCSFPAAAVFNHSFPAALRMFG